MRKFISNNIMILLAFFIILCAITIKLLKFGYIGDENLIVLFVLSTFFIINSLIKIFILFPKRLSEEYELHKVFLHSKVNVGTFFNNFYNRDNSYNLIDNFFLRKNKKTLFTLSIKQIRKKKKEYPHALIRNNFN